MKKKCRFGNLTKRDLNVIRNFHISLLAKPKLRCLQPWPNPELEQTLPAPASQAAMNAKPSKRIIMLFKSKKVSQQRKKYTPPAKPTHYVSPAALKAIASRRTRKLAKPKREHKKKKKLTKQQLQKLKAKYKRYKKNREEWLKKNAAPKKVPQPPPLETPTYVTKRPSPTLAESLKRIYNLAVPAKRGSKLLPPKVKFTKFKIRELSDRVRQLALPKNIHPETLKDMKFIPGQIKKSALKAVASERTVILAKPRPRIAKVDDSIRTEPLVISRAALKYKASRRITELARPRVRK